MDWHRPVYSGRQLKFARGLMVAKAWAYPRTGKEPDEIWGEKLFLAKKMGWRELTVSTSMARRRRWTHRRLDVGEALGVDI